MTDRKLALITGGSRGLGRAAALNLAHGGADVIITYVANADAAAETVNEARSAGARAAALPLDTSKTSGFAAFADQLRTTLKDDFGRETIDFLLNNAGTLTPASIAETTEQQFDDLANIHLKGVFFLTQHLLPLIADGGKILNVSTGLTRFTMPGLAAYSAMKGGVEVFTRYLAQELGPRGITVNAIAPGAIETDIAGGFVRDMPEVNAEIAADTTLGRVGLPDDIGGAVASHLLGDTGWITAQRIEVSGGQHL